MTDRVEGVTPAWHRSDATELGLGRALVAVREDAASLTDRLADGEWGAPSAGDLGWLGDAP